MLCETCKSMPGNSLVFFFQAEDGIRDDLVTGVQTCALPISSALDDRQGRWGQRPRVVAWPARQVHVRIRARRHQARSEERRVGKSVDLGGRRIIKKKKSNGT